MTSRRRPVMLGIDPGSMVGIAAYQKGRFDQLQLPALEAVPWVRGWLIGATLRGELVDIALERLVRGSATGHHLSPRGMADAEEVIASVRSLARTDFTEDQVAVYLQGAATAKKVIQDRVLKKAGWYRPGRPHGNDASRHLGALMLRRYPREYIRVVLGQTAVDNQVEEA